MVKEHSQLPKVAFSILLAVSLRPRHGYEIMQQVAEDSQGRIKLGPGALYTSIRQLHEQGLIDELEENDQRRRYYRLSEKGSRALQAELAYFEAAIKLARDRHVGTGKVRHAFI